MTEEPPRTPPERKRLRAWASFRTLSWLYRRLGPAYPTLAVTFVLLGGLPVAVVSTLILGVYVTLTASQFASFMAIALGVAALSATVRAIRSHLRLRPVRRWMRGEHDQAATAAAWEAAISLPALGMREPVLATVCVIAPLTAAGHFVLELEPLGLVALLAGIAVTAGYASALDYFTLESVLRPVVADVAESLPRAARTGARTVSLRFKLLAALPLVNVITGVIVAGITSPGEGIAALGVGVLAATGVAFTISLLLTLRVSATVLRPVADLRRASELVESGDLDVAVPVTSGDEIGQLAESFNRMVSGLAERERIREAFGTYLDPDVAEHVLADTTPAQGEEVEATMLFLDVRGFTGYAETAEAPEVVATLNRLFGVVVPAVRDEGGHVDKFIGDGALAVFGTPRHQPDHAARALRAALRISREVVDQLGGELEIGIGINTGTVVAGSIGAAGRLEFSVIGDAVNVASRVEAATRQTDDAILLTQTTRDLLGDGTMAFEARPGIELRGRSGTVTLYAPAGPVPQPVGDEDGDADAPGVPARRRLRARLRRR